MPIVPLRPRFVNMKKSRPEAAVKTLGVMAAMKCINKKCSAELADGAAYCHACGRKTTSTPKKKSRPDMYWDGSRKRWRKRVTVGGRRHAVFGKTLEEVRGKIKELERQHAAGVTQDDQTPFAEFCMEWYKVKKAGLKPKSAEVYNNALSVHILPFFGNAKLADIKPLHVQKLLAQKPELSKSSRSKILNTLSQIMKSAQSNGLISKTPCDGIEAGGRDAQAKVPLTGAQQMELVRAVKGARCEIFTLLCLFAGLRKEEALGLAWDNVHLDAEAPYLDVRHTVTFDKGRPVHSPQLKSKAAYRSIPIPRILSMALEAKMDGAESPLVVAPVRSDGAMSESAFSRMWEAVTGHSSPVAARDPAGRVVKGADGKTVKGKKRYPGLVGFHVTPHLLRHTYITELCASGLDIKKIQYLAGHEDVSMTLRVYAHVTQNTPKELSPQIIETFSGTISGT